MTVEAVEKHLNADPHNKYTRVFYYDSNSLLKELTFDKIKELTLKLEGKDGLEHAEHIIVIG